MATCFKVVEETIGNCSVVGAGPASWFAELAVWFSPVLGVPGGAGAEVVSLPLALPFPLPAAPATAV